MVSHVTAAGADPTGKCTRRLAHSVARKLWCHSYQAAADQFTAAIVSRHSAINGFKRSEAHRRAHALQLTLETSQKLAALNNVCRIKAGNKLPLLLRRSPAQTARAKAAITAKTATSSGVRHESHGSSSSGPLSPAKTTRSVVVETKLLKVVKERAEIAVKLEQRIGIEYRPVINVERDGLPCVSGAKLGNLRPSAAYFRWPAVVSL